MTDSTEPVPTSIIASDTAATDLRVVDAATGEPIPRVITADAAAGKLTRFAVADGNLVREGDRFVVIEEERAVRIERVELITTEEMVAGPAGDVATDAEG